MLVEKIFTPEEFIMYRNAMGMSEKQIADEFLISKQSINNFERGFHVTKCTMQFYTMGILKLWERVPEDEREWRLECGKAGVNVGFKRNKRTVEYIKQHI